MEVNVQELIYRARFEARSDQERRAALRALYLRHVVRLLEGGCVCDLHGSQIYEVFRLPEDSAREVGVKPAFEVRFEKEIAAAGLVVVRCGGLSGSYVLRRGDVS